MSDVSNILISTIFRDIDQVGNDLVFSTYHQLANYLSPIIWLLLAILIGLDFLKCMQFKMDYSDLVTQTLKRIILITLALNYSYFTELIYNIFTKEPLSIMKLVVVHGTSNTIDSALDNYFVEGIKSGSKMFMMGSWSNLTYFIFGLIVMIVVSVSTIIAAGLIILAKIGTLLLLALSPLFIMAALTEMTVGIFNAYIRNLITYALIPIIASAALMIILNVSHLILNNTGSDGKLSLSSIIPLVFMGGIQIYLLAHVKEKATALGAGFTLRGIVATYGHVKASSWDAARSAYMNTREVAGKLSSIGRSQSKSAMGSYKNPSN